MPEDVIHSACQAVRAGRLLELQFGGVTRRVEVHAAGRDDRGYPMARVWQVAAVGARKERPGWKLLRLSDASTATLLDEPSMAPRPGYRRNDPAMSRIHYEV